MKRLPLLLLSLCSLLSVLNSQTINLDFPSVNGAVRALAVDGNTLYIAGQFIEVDEIPRKNLAAIDLESGDLLDWSPEADEPVNCITIENGVVYVCGPFQNINGTPRNTLAAISQSDGSLTDWNPDIVFPGIPDMQTGSISGIAIYNSDIYLAGYFLSINGESRSNIAGIDAQGNLLAWNPVFNIPTERVVINGDLLYVSGPFSEVEGQMRNTFVSFDLSDGSLTDWDPLVNTQPVSSSYVYPQDDYVFVSGSFTELSGEYRGRVGKVNASTGAVLPWQVDILEAAPSIRAFASRGDRLFMGGNFTLDNGTNESNLTALNLETGAYEGWSAPMDNSVTALLIANDRLIVSGNFTTISNENKRGLAVYDLSIVDALEELPDSEVSIFPKPASDEVNIHFNSDQVEHLELYDLNGILIKTQNTQGAYNHSMNLENLASGMYTLVFRSASGEILKADLLPVQK